LNGLYFDRLIGRSRKKLWPVKCRRYRL